MRDSIVNLVQDYRAGVISDWPDGYTAGVVDGVRMTIRESDSAHAELMRRD